MRRGQGKPLPIPSEEEIVATVAKESGVVACSGVRRGPLIVLSMALHNGGTATVYLDALGQTSLLAALKALVPNSESIPASQLIDGELGLQVQEGNRSV
jgi:hypothetical protein